MAARNQGDEAFDRFHLALLKAKHEAGKDHGRRATLLAVAKEVGLDLERFERDLDDRSVLPLIGKDYTEGKERYGAFGTPTFVFPDGASCYLKMLPAAPADEALPFFEEFVRTVRSRPYISEIKRPQPPATG